MSKVNVRVKVKRIYSNTPSVIADVKSNSAEAAYRFAQGVTYSAKARCPVRTGALKASIQRTKIGDRHHQVRVGEFYGVYVEYGTRHMAAQPYFRPAIEEHKRMFHVRMTRVFR